MEEMKLPPRSVNDRLKKTVPQIQYSTVGFKKKKKKTGLKFISGMSFSNSL